MPASSAMVAPRRYAPAAALSSTAAGAVQIQLLEAAEIDLVVLGSGQRHGGSFDSHC